MESILLTLVSVVIGIAFGYGSMLKIREDLRELGTKSKQTAEALDEGLQRVLETYFDPVTREIFRKLKSNVSLAARLSDEFEKDKSSLGEFLCFPVDSLASGGEGDHAIARRRRDPFMGIFFKESEPRLFIESGSTLAFLTLKLKEQSYLTSAAPASQVVITTNNVLTDFMCIFEPNIQSRLFPGTPIGRYGATFGKENPPDERPEAIRLWRELGDNLPKSYEGTYTGEQAQLDAMNSEIRGFFRNNVPQAFLLTTSSISLVNGPHVGSFQNRDFKKTTTNYAKEVRIPVFMILVDSKIHDGPMDPSKCLAIFEDDYPPGQDPRNYDVSNTEGMKNFAQAIADGDVILVITSAQGRSAPDSPSLKLADALREYEEKIDWIHDYAYNVHVFVSETQQRYYNEIVSLNGYAKENYSKEN